MTKKPGTYDVGYFRRIVINGQKVCYWVCYKANLSITEAVKLKKQMLYNYSSPKYPWQIYADPETFQSKSKD